MKVIVVGTLPSSLYNFRRELLQHFKGLGYDVKSLSSGASSEDIKLVERLGVDYIDYPVSRSGLSPTEDFQTFMALRNIFKEHQPDLILAYTIKPIIWGGLATIFIRDCRFYALVTGLGFVFQNVNWKRKCLLNMVVFLYRKALGRANKVIFQNPDDRQVFIDAKIVREHETEVVNGSGVNVSHFKIRALPKSPRFLLIARLLGDKGIREYVEAASMVKLKFPEAEFQLVGPEDPSPDGISINEINRLNTEGAIDYMGETKDVRPYLERCSVFVLPSYHEGLPRTVLEAMATGRPILTTDVPGCKETVVNGKNGWLVEKANVEQLAERMIWFIENQSEWRRMGNVSREIVEEKFDVHKVNTELMKIMELE